MSEYFDNTNTVDNAIRFIGMINCNRFLNKSTWIEIGESLHSITNGSSDGEHSGLSVWIAYTNMALDNRDSPDFITTSVSDTCTGLYSTFDNNGLTIKTLAWYARLDNPDDYRKWHDEWCNNALEQSLDKTHVNVAKFLYRIYWLDIAYSERQWFKFKNGKWRKTIGVKTFERKIFDDLKHRYAKYSQINKVFTDIKYNLSSLSFRCNVMKELTAMFHSSFDTNYNILGVTNGVLEITENGIVFRNAKPEDYISMSTNVPYEADFSWENCRVRTCIDIFRSFFPDKTSLHNFLKIMSSTLGGVLKINTVHVLKSTKKRPRKFIMTLLNEVYDDYFQNNVFYMPYRDFYTLKGKRVTFHNCDDDHSLDKLHIKLIVGGDCFFNSKSGTLINISPVVFLTCNETLNIQDCDLATIKRLNSVELVGTYNGDYDQIAKLAPAFLWIMTQYYSLYVTEKLEYHPFDPNDVISSKSVVPLSLVLDSETCDPVTPDATIRDPVTPDATIHDPVAPDATIHDPVTSEVHETSKSNCIIC